MKQLLTLAIIFTSYLAFGQKNFSQLKVSDNMAYAYTDKKPLLLKKGNPQRSSEYVATFLSSLRTEDDQRLILSQVNFVEDPNHKQVMHENYMTANGYSHYMGSGVTKKGMLQRYSFVTSEKNDSVTFYVDIYSKGELKIPKGFKLKL